MTGFAAAVVNLSIGGGWLGRAGLEADGSTWVYFPSLWTRIGRQVAEKEVRRVRSAQHLWRFSE